jgi:hypothetical protein
MVLFTQYSVRAIGPRPVAALRSVCGGLAATLNLAFVLAVVLVLSKFTYHDVELPGSKNASRGSFGTQMSVHTSICTLR